jgi:hypothetical protein
MTAISEKVAAALSEARILVLGGQILLGFQLQSAFHETFDKLPPNARGSTPRRCCSWCWRSGC